MRYGVNSGISSKLHILTNKRRKIVGAMSKKSITSLNTILFSVSIISNCKEGKHQRFHISFSVYKFSAIVVLIFIFSMKKTLKFFDLNLHASLIKKIFYFGINSSNILRCTRTAKDSSKKSTNTKR